MKRLIFAGASCAALLSVISLQSKVILEPALQSDQSVNALDEPVLQSDQSNDVIVTSQEKSFMLLLSQLARSHVHRACLAQEFVHIWIRSVGSH